MKQNDEEDKLVRPIVTVNGDACKGCGLCVSVCPRQVLEISRSHFNARGVYPAAVIKQEVCIGCASCALMCPDGAITVEKEME